jgi:hypothetical protein
VTDWLKPGTTPPEAASDELFATPSGAIGSPDDSAPTQDDAALADEMSPPAAPGVTRSGQATGASGGYGTASGLASSGGSGEATEETSDAGDDNQTEWLRDAPGGGDER